jgi:hypothetical protein
VLPEVGLYDVSWKLHVKQSATPAGTASVCIYVDAGGIAGTTGTSPTSDVTTPGAVIRTGSTVPIQGSNPVELVGRAFIRTLNTNTAISIRNSDASAEFECGAAGACDNLIIRRIDYAL